MTWLATVLDQEMLETIRKVNIAGRNTADAAVTSAPAACRFRVWNLMLPRTGATGGHPPPEGAKVGYAHPDRFDAERGETHYRQALALAEPRGMRPLVAHCHLGLGKLCART